MKYANFEDLPVWQMARRFVNRIYSLIDASGSLKKDFSLVDQLKRASYSIMLNISEGFERGSNKEFANFVNIAKGSAGEVRSILYILADRKYISAEVFKQATREVLEISTNLSNFRKYLVAHKEFTKLRPN